MKITVTGKEIKKMNVGDLISMSAAIEDIDCKEIKEQLGLTISEAKIRKHIKGYVNSYVEMFNHAKHLVPDDSRVDIDYSILDTETIEVVATIALGEMKFEYKITMHLDDEGVHGTFEVSGLDYFDVN